MGMLSAFSRSANLVWIMAQMSAGTGRPDAPARFDWGRKNKDTDVKYLSQTTTQTEINDKHLATGFTEKNKAATYVKLDNRSRQLWLTFNGMY